MKLFFIKFTVQKSILLSKHTACDLLPGVRRHAEDEKRKTGEEEARNDEVKDVIQLASLYTNGERYVDVLLWAAVIRNHIAFGRHPCSSTIIDTSYSR